MARLDVALAAAAFAALCVLVLRTAPFMPEPDDVAYQGSIVAMTQGHFLTLSTAQVHALAAQLARSGGIGPRGEIRFGLSAVLPNLRYMPAHLINAMPMLVLALAALAWITWRRVRLRGADGEAGRELGAGLGGLAGGDVRAGRLVIQ